MAKTPESEPGEVEKETPAQEEMSAALKNMAEAVEGQKPEGQQSPATEKGEPAGDKMSRRSFLKKAAMGLAAAFIAPEAFGEKEKPLLDITVDGQRIVFRPEDIEGYKGIAEHLEKKVPENIAESFDPEIQQAIVKNIGDKLREGLLKAQELGFKFAPTDTQHVHPLVEDGFLKSIKRKYPRAMEMPQGEVAAWPSKEDMVSLTKEVKALIFHCAEAPSSSELTSEKFMREKYPHRSIEVDENGQVSNAKTKHPRIQREGRVPDFGFLAPDYNELKGTNLHDLANENLYAYSEFSTDIQFLPASEKDGGVRLDPRLPALKFVISGYNRYKDQTNK